SLSSPGPGFRLAPQGAVTGGERKGQIMKANLRINLPAVSCRDLTKDFGEGESRARVLRGVDLEADAGAITLLVGPRGRGKATRRRGGAGRRDPTGGGVRVRGTALGRLSPAGKVAFRRQHIGFVFQQYNLLPALTAAENAAVPLLIAGRPRRDALARARAL